MAALPHRRQQFACKNFDTSTRWECREEEIPARVSPKDARNECTFFAPKIVRDVMKVIEHLRDEGVSVLVVEQNVHTALAVAEDEDQREIGLMGRSDIPEDAGMLFVFGSEIEGAFWPNQYENLSNPASHYQATMDEIATGKGGKQGQGKDKDAQSGQEGNTE